MWLWAEQKKLSSFLPDTTGVFVNLHSEVVARRSSVKKMFLKNSQKLQENTWVGVSFLKNVAGFRLLTLFKKRIHLGFFLVNFMEFLWTVLFIEQIWCLLLHILSTQTYFQIHGRFQNQMLFRKFWIKWVYKLFKFSKPELLSVKVLLPCNLMIMSSSGLIAFPHLTSQKYCWHCFTGSIGRFERFSLKRLSTASWKLYK